MHVANLKTRLGDPSFEPVTATREERMAEDGVLRYRTKQDRLAARGTAADRDDYASLIRQSLLDVANRIEEAVERDATKKSAGPRGRLLLKLEEIGVDKEDGYRGVTIAYITLSTLFSSLVKNNDKAQIATRIGSYLENERNFGFIASTQPKLWSRLLRFAKERGSYRHRARFVLNTAAKENVVVEEWSLEDRTFLGEWLLGLVAAAGLIELRLIMSGAHRKTEVILAEPILAWLAEYREKADAGSLPMISPIMSPLTRLPRDWSTPWNGGYEQLRHPLVKQGRADYAAADMSRVYAAVNAMQRTVWRVHPGMLELVERLWAEGQKLGKLPVGISTPVPPRLTEVEWEAMTPEAKKGRMLEMRDIHDHNRQAASDLATIDMVLAQARELETEPSIYMPYQLDYRGRAYCQPLLNPQGPDYIRAMLELAHGKPVGARGAMWLAIQLATLWDGEYRGKRLSKSSFQDRYDWVLEHEFFLRGIVTNALGDRRWANADKPFLFLRTAIDWVGFLDHGENYVSNVPIALDGSCSGIQHYAAMLRDTSVGARVNLLPCEAPADVYGDVADMIAPVIETDDSEGALFWRTFGVTRKIVKKPVMTYGYSSREPGFTTWYEQEFVRAALKAWGRRDTPSNPIARYLAKATLLAVEECLPAVANGMDWLISCASLLAHEGKGISWVAPSGFPVTQRYISAPSVRVETYLGGERLRVSIPGASKTVNKDKQKSAISPNHTHSLDAAHLMLTVLQAKEYGVESFALIHDSFGTLAADTDAMFDAVRTSFVAMYTEHDPLQHLYEQVHEALSEAGKDKLQLPPAKGDLDLSQVLQSLYAFA
jgi:DNA-directed RNA polymerase